MRLFGRPLRWLTPAQDKVHRFRGADSQSHAVEGGEKRWLLQSTDILDFLSQIVSVEHIKHPVLPCAHEQTGSRGKDWRPGTEVLILVVGIPLMVSGRIAKCDVPIVHPESALARACPPIIEPDEGFGKVCRPVEVDRAPGSGIEPAVSRNDIDVAFVVGCRSPGPLPDTASKTLLRRGNGSGLRKR